MLFGDAAALVLSTSPSSERGVLCTELHADGRFARALCMDIWDISKKPYLSEQAVASADIWPQMDGKTVFKHAVTRLCEVIQHTLDVNGLKGEDIKYVMPHQANMRINQMVAQKLGFPEGKFLHNMRRYGNTTAASIPLLLNETYRNGMLQAGDLVLMAAFGSGFTWGSALLRWSFEEPRPLGASRRRRALEKAPMPLCAKVPSTLV